MKKFKWILILWTLILLCSCQHYIIDKPGIVKDIKMLERDKDKWKYEVIISGQEISALTGRYHFYTNQLYQVGDTVYIGKIYNQTKDTIQ